MNFDAYVVGVLFDRSGAAVFALGDGTVRFESGAVVEAHPDAGLLSAALHPSGEGVVTGGDDGRLVWSRAGEAPVQLDARPGCWIEAVATSAESGLIAFAAGREAGVLDVQDPSFRRVFAHERTVADVAFDPKGRKLACATYGAATLWFARIADQTPQTLKWAGAHIGVSFSPDAKYLITKMQENALHGWRLADAKDMRMSGYAAKPRSIVFLAKGALMASSGASGAVIWPFTGATGPMGKEAAEVVWREGSLVTRVAAALASGNLAGGSDDGRVWWSELASSRVAVLREAGAPVTALAVSPDGRRIAWGDEDGGAGVVDAPF
jgi:WD40 repeat protein